MLKPAHKAALGFIVSGSVAFFVLPVFFGVREAYQDFTAWRLSPVALL